MLNLSFPRKVRKTGELRVTFVTFVTFSAKNSPGVVFFVPPTEKCIRR